MPALSSIVPTPPSTPSPTPAPPSTLAQGTRTRWDPGVQGTAALIAVALVSVLFAGLVAWRARPQPVAAPSARPAVVPAPSSIAAGPTVVVHVAGGVVRPGVVTLPPGSRVMDALKAAGGVRRGVATGALNLARRLVDGEQLLVGASALPAAPAAALPPTAAPVAPDANDALDLNSATAGQLDALPGVGPVLAQRIVDYRTKHGPFRDVGQLREIEGIGERRFADLRARIRV